MSNKRLFQVFDEMNVNDGVNNTATCACCFDMVDARTAKGGGNVTMGVPDEAIIKIMNNEYKPIMILLDYNEYKRLEAIPLDDKLHEAQQENKEWKEECDRLAKQVEFWQAKYNDLKGPSFTPPKIDNNPIA